MTRILGIDTGTNSHGWAVVDRNEETGTYTLVKKGSLIFQEGVTTKKSSNGKIEESSKAAERRKYRGQRHLYFRRRLRKIEVLKVLVRYGWCPYLSDEALHQWHVKKQYPLDDDFMKWQRTDEADGKNPYVYRHRCLHERLDLTTEAGRYTLGRALYHLAQRRGFISNRRDQNDDKETGKIKAGISELSEEMAALGCEYLGDYFYRLYTEQGNAVRIRCRYTARKEHYLREFRAICRQQQLSEKQVQELENALYFQRKIKGQRQNVGKCTFEPRRPRCADSHPDFERYRMLSFLNNVKVKGPNDSELRPLNDEERARVEPLFYRKTKSFFYFKEIAIEIAGREDYCQYIKEAGDLPYKFNHDMLFGIAGCPTTAQLRAIFGNDYKRGIAAQYTLSAGKTAEQMADDVWNVLFSFKDKEKRKAWGMEKLQLTEKEAEKFSKIKLTRSYADLSLYAIRMILPWLERTRTNAHAIFMAKIPDIVGREVWEADRATITAEVLELINGYNPSDAAVQGTFEENIKGYLLNNFELENGAVNSLYHPSKIEAFPDARPDANGIYQLPQLRTNIIRNPMAMRSLHQLRKLINMLLREGTITPRTEVHIEYARELNDSNMRAAIRMYNQSRERKRKEYAEEIIRLYKENTGRDITLKYDDIRKYELWIEQNKTCLYTGDSIGIADFIGPDPKYDIEHTIPQSIGGDSTMENLTLCSKYFNREVKGAKLPSQLVDYEKIVARLEPWREKIEKLRYAVDKIHTDSSMKKEDRDGLIQKRHRLRLELNYWRGKYKRFTMTEVPEGFARRQGAGIGLIGKYAGLLLKSVFHDPDNHNRSNVRVIKGAVTAEFREMWGIQEKNTKKSRDNHVHHCVDAIVIACISSREHNALARYYRQKEEYDRDRATRPVFPKPWPTFTEDIKAIANEVLVVHDTPDNLPKQSKRKAKTAKGSFFEQGDTARGSLHKDKYYGAIERDGKICYVIRRALADLEMDDIKNIVDDSVRAIVKAAVAQQGIEALKGKIYMNEEKGVLIKKVRCKIGKKPFSIGSQRDVSDKEYKRDVYVLNESNYMLAIYEGFEKGKAKRDYELVKNIDAAEYFKGSTDREDFTTLVPEKSPHGYPLRWKLKIGMHVILYENSPEEINMKDKKDLARRLYYIKGLNLNPSGKGYGAIVMRHHQEARADKDQKTTKGIFKNDDNYREQISVLHTQFRALVEGYDFRINALGEVELINKDN